MNRWVYGFMLAIGIALPPSQVAFMQAQEKPRLSDASALVANALRDLGRCEAQLPALRELQAARVDGSLVDLDTVKRRIESANPDLMLNPQTFKLSPKAEKD
jgi:hypothetical protein